MRRTVECQHTNRRGESPGTFQGWPFPLSDRDPSADPGVDFYRFANGGWLDANPIPAGYGAWGSFEEVSRRNEVVLRELLERAAAEPADALDRLLGDAFAAGLDLDAIEAAGHRADRAAAAAIEAPRARAVLALLPRCTGPGSSRCSAGA